MTEMPLRDQFSAGLARAAATVSIFTTNGPGGRAEVTVSAMRTVPADSRKSARLVCVTKRLLPAVRSGKTACSAPTGFGDSQAYLADAFAGRFRDEITGTFDATTGSPLPTWADGLDHAWVSFDCRIAAQDRIGTRHAFLGEVQ